MVNEPVMYFAAALFNGRESYLNSKLTEKLENKRYKLHLPQRDGFEFTDLSKALEGKIKSKDREKATSSIIYLLDMGKFIPESDVVLANLDEPLDEGVITEITYANALDKFVVGWRTDSRSPYGKPGGPLQGIHSFPANQADKIILHSMTSKTSEEGEEQLNSLVEKIDEVISEGKFKDQGLPDYVCSNPNLYSPIEKAKILFDGMNDIHSEKGLEKIASRYINNKEELEEERPW